MKALVDTHFVLWIASRSPRLAELPWLERYRPWLVSPVSLLEVRLLAEVGRIEAEPELEERLLGDPRFTFDEVPLGALVRHALGLDA